MGGYFLHHFLVGRLKRFLGRCIIQQNVLWCVCVCVCVCMLLTYTDMYYILECAKSLQLCLTLCDSMDHMVPDSSVHGILQAGILEWVAISSSRGSFQPRDRTGQ